MARHGGAGHGSARQGVLLLCSYAACRGGAWLGKARQGKTRQGVFNMKTKKIPSDWPMALCYIFQPTNVFIICMTIIAYIMWSKLFLT